MARNTSFYFAFLTLPAPQRRAILAVFDFCRAVDDSVDLESDPPRAAVRAGEWRAEVERMFTGAAPATPEGRRLQPFVAQFRLSRENFDALVDGVAMDTEPRRFATFAELESYCHRVASAVGLMSMEIFGPRGDAARVYARDLGVALQLTNILRDVAVDLRRGRIYLPTEDLDRFGVVDADLRREAAEAGRGVQSARVLLLLEHHAARARVFFSRAVRALPAADRRPLVAAETMREIYWRLLQRIEDAHCDVFSGVIRVPKPTRVVLAAGTWWRARQAGSR